MRRRNRSAHLALLAALAASCSGAPSSPPWTPEVVAPRALEDFCAEAVPAYCGHLARCRPEAAAEPYGDCLTGQGAAWCAGLLSSRRLAAVGAGRLRWEAFRAGRCVQDLAAPACRGAAMASSCAADSLLTGRVAGGEACLGGDPEYLQECARGACQVSGPCAGTCPAVGGEGAACHADAQCAPGLGCVDDATGAPCGSDGCACRPRLLEGDECAATPGAPACQPGLACQLGRCERVRAGPGPLVALPGPFAVYPDCDGALTIAYQAGGPVCVARSGGGERCREIWDCEAGLTCREGGRCGPFLAGPGPCERRQDGGDCAVGWTCGVGGCRPRATSEGQACTSCFGGGLTCDWDGVGFSCQGPAPLGVACYLRPCAEPLWCDEACATPPCVPTCRERLPAGSTCASAAACSSGTCYQGSCVDACALP